MIEDDHVVEEKEASVGDGGLVRMRVGNALGPSGHAVAEESDRSAEERRKRFLLIDTQRAQLFVQQCRGIWRVAIESNAAPRIETDKRIAADVLSPLHALEQKRLGTLPAQRGKGRNRCQRVGGELPHHGNDVEVATKLIEIHRQAFTKSSF